MTHEEKEGSSDIPDASPELKRAAELLLGAERKALLLVEDTAAHAALFRRALGSEVWEIEHLTRAHSALQSFSQDPHRIVLLDLSLPDSDGLKLLTELHAIQPESPIVVVTATDEVSMSVGAMKRGAWDYVVKGEPEETTQAILDALDKAWQTRLKNAEDYLIEQTKLVEMVRTERTTAVESIVRTVCVEVNNPLGGVLALCQVLSTHEKLDPALVQIVDEITTSATRVAEVVKKLYHIHDRARSTEHEQ